MPIIMTQPIPEAPSVGEQLFTALLGGISKYQKSKTDRRIREAIRRALGEEPEKQTPVGRFLSTLFEPPLTEAEGNIYSDITKERIKSLYPSELEKAQAEYYRKKAEKVGKPIEVPPGFEITGYTAENEPIIRKIKKTEAERFREDLQRAKTGEIGWNELKDLYPDKADKITQLQRASTPIGKEPIKPAGFWEFWKRAKPEFAWMNAPTRRVIENIKTQADLDELITNKKAYEEAGVNVNAIIKYFTNY